MLEIERKFLLTSLPDLPSVEHIRMGRGYIAIDPEVRITSFVPVEGEPFYKLAVKSSGALVREEVETLISESLFHELVTFIDKRLISKDYRVYLYNGYRLECAVVDAGLPTEFIYGEVEFSSVEEGNAFEWPFPGATDVTYTPAYKMKNYWRRTRLKEEL